MTNELRLILEDIWLRLRRGVTKPKDAFHSGVVATQAGDEVSLRTVILRKVVPSERLLFFHTDFRSQKITQLQQNSKVSWLFYDAKASIQIRLKTQASIHFQDEISETFWQEASVGSRKIYNTQLPPATPLSMAGDALPPEWKNRLQLNPEDVAEGYANFAVVVCKVQHIDYLELQKTGHKRCQWQWENEQNDWQSQWVVP